MKRLKVKYYDRKIEFQENIRFLKRLFRSSRQGLLISILFIGFLISLDIFAKIIINYFYLSPNNAINKIAILIYRINDLIGVKFLDYFKDVIVIVAGVLGVILGLFFTTFLNIITSKYSNINSTIISQLLEQRIINHYFKLLAILVSSSIIFQFLLVVGYHPTFISAFLFSLIVIITLLAFLFFGRYSLIYFNAGNLVFDLIDSSNKTLNRVYKNKKYFHTDSNGEHTLFQIIGYIDKIKIIVEESSKPQFSNTALDSISNELLGFAIRYNSFKHTFPSSENWHPKTRKFKRWDEASTTEHELYGSIGSSLYPETVDDFLYIEMQIINTQFFIFRNLLIDKKVQVIYKQYQYLQIVSFQCENELFISFFDQLEKFVKENLFEEEDKKDIEANIQLISLYSNLIIQYLVGFNQNVQRSVSESQLKKLAKAIHYFGDTDLIIQFPYKIRIWADKYQSKLKNEEFNESRIITPLFYTEFELAREFQLILKSYFEKLSSNIHVRIITFSEYLKSRNLNIESLEFLSESLESLKKIEFFSGILKTIIEKDLNALNLKKETNFNFTERDDIVLKNQLCRKAVISKIWEVGYYSYNVKNKDLPDLFGNFYQLICQDILDKSFEDQANYLTLYLPKYYTYNLLYIENLRHKVDSEKLEYSSSKLFPIIVDLFEISAIAIIMFKLFDDKNLEDSFHKYWNTKFDNEGEEERFWSLIMSIYNYFNQPIFALSTPSYIREDNRKNRLEEFLKDCDLVEFVEESNSGEFPSQVSYYKTNCEDVYIKQIVRNLTNDGFGFGHEELADVFIEYYLRTRISLQNLNIKETRYGSELRRIMERDSE